MNPLDKHIIDQVKITTAEFAELKKLAEAEIEQREKLGKYQSLERETLQMAVTNVEVKVEHVKGKLSVSGSGTIDSTTREILDLYKEKITDITKDHKKASDKLVSAVKKHCPKKFTGKFELAEPQFINILE